MLTESMYGTGAAGHDWQSEVARRMTNVEFNQGKASPRVFWHRQRETSKHSFKETTSCHQVKRAELERLCKRAEE